MVAAQAVLTARGGMTSHGSRLRGKEAVCRRLRLARHDYRAGTIGVAGRVLNEGDFITIDGASGRVMLGEVPP